LILFVTFRSLRPLLRVRVILALADVLRAKVS
jgi:hypothetical protein